MTHLVGGPFCRIEWKSINLNSSQQVKDYLFQHGWVPDEYNYKKDKNGRVVRGPDGEPLATSPKLTESSFHTVEGEVPKLVARRNILVHRKRMLKNIRKTDEEPTGWLNAIRSDGRIGAGGIPIGTPTSRVRHVGVVNVPSVEAVYGYSIRGLFTTEEGYTLIGVDAQALEARIQAHYIWPFKGGPELADLLINGDIHLENASLWGCSRKHAKSPYYCLMYGGQVPKFSKTLGVDERQGSVAFEAFWNKYSPLANFKDTLTKVWESRGGKKGGFIRALDGRKLWARSKHSLVNLMFQAGGSIIVKRATIIFNDKVRHLGDRVKQVLHFHDEFQVECHLSIKDEVKQYALEAFEESGKYYGLNVPILGDVKEGRSWAETH